jgi:hypothetical protein
LKPTKASNGVISTQRRNLQKAYLEKMISMLDAKTPARRNYYFSVKRGPVIDPKLTDIVSISHGELLKLQEKIKKSAKRSSDQMTKNHLNDCLFRLEKTLEVK